MSKLDFSQIKTTAVEVFIKKLAGFSGVGVHCQNLSSGSVYWSRDMYTILGLPPEYPASIGTLLSITEEKDSRYIIGLIHAAKREGKEGTYSLFTKGERAKEVDIKFFRQQFQGEDYLCILVRESMVRERVSIAPYGQRGPEAIDYHEVIQHAPETILLINRQGDILESNLKAVEMFGYEAAVLKSMNIQDLLHGTSRENQLYLLDLVNTDHHLIKERVFCDKNGKPIEVEVNSKLIRNGMVVQVFIRDISYRRDMEEVLKSSESLSQRLVENSSNAILIQKLDRTILYANRRTAELLGTEKPTDLIGMSTSMFTLPEYEPIIQERISEVLRTDKGVGKFEQVFRCLDGSFKTGESVMIPFDYYGEKSTLIVVTDITDIKNALLELKASEERLCSFIENAPVAVAMFDTSMNYVACSRRWLQDWWEREEVLTTKSIVGQNHYELFPKITDDWKKSHQRIMSGETEIKEGDHFVMESGKTEWIQWEGHPWVATGGEIGGIILYTDFITDRKQKEAIIIESEARNKALINAMPDLMFILDVNGVYIDYQSKDRAKLISHPGDLIGRNISEFFEDDLTERFSQAIQHVISTDEVQLVEYPIPIKGKAYHFESRIVKYKEDQVLAVVRDITKNKEDEHIKWRLREMFHKAFHMNPTPVIIIKVKNEEILNANKKFFELVKMEMEEVVGKTLSELNYLKSNAKQKKFLGLVQRKGHVYDLEANIQNKYGEQKNVILSGELIDVDGEICALVMLFDITDRKKDEDRLKKVTEELTKYNQELQQFAFIISHNLRAPVMNLSSLVNFYDKDNPDNEDNKLLFDKIEKSIERLDSTLADLMNIVERKQSRYEEKVSIDFQELLDGVLSAIEDMVLKSGIEVRSDFSEVPGIDYPRSHAQSIFQNLITNAIKYRSHKRPSYLKVSSKREGGFVCIHFEDNGVGIDLEKFGEKLFSMYQRFHVHIEGKGLGLYIVKSQIEDLGGRLEVKSKIDQGTTFSVFLKEDRPVPSLS